MRTGKIIVIDDNEAVLKTLRVILQREFRTVLPVKVPYMLPALLREDDVDVVVLDMNFGSGRQTGGEGLYWLDRIRERMDPPEVVLITAFGDIELAVASLKKGAADFVVKPWDNDKLIAAVVAAWDKKREKTEPAPSPSSSPSLTLDDIEKQFIQTVLAEKNGNLTLAAQQLHITRQTLYNKMKKYGL